MVVAGSGVRGGCRIEFDPTLGLWWWWWVRERGCRIGSRSTLRWARGGGGRGGFSGVGGGDRGRGIEFDPILGWGPSGGGGFWWSEGGSRSGLILHWAKVGGGLPGGLERGGVGSSLQLDPKLGNWWWLVSGRLERGSAGSTLILHLASGVGGGSGWREGGGVGSSLIPPGGLGQWWRWWISEVVRGSRIEFDPTLGQGWW